MVNNWYIYFAYCTADKHAFFMPQYIFTIDKLHSDTK